MKSLTTRTAARRILLGCLTLALALGAASAEAQCTKPTISIPDDVYSNSGNCIPFSQCIGGGEARYQWYIDRKFIGCAGFIKDIDIRPTSTFSFTADDFEIRISHTTQTAHSSNLNTNLPAPVVVHPAAKASFSGTNATWSSLGLKSTFAYDGTSHLTIEARMRNLLATPSSTVFSDSVSITGFTRTYALGSGTYNTATTTTSRTHVGGALKIRLHFALAALTGSGTTRPGGVVTLALAAPSDVGLPYQLGSSLGTGPIPIDTRQLNLSPDDLLRVSVNDLWPWIFAAYRGVMDNQGQAKAAINIPNLAALIGVRIHTAFVTVSPSAPSGLQSISNTFSFSVTK